MSLVLAKLLEELTAGRLRVVDLTQPLTPQTPLLPLPTQWNNTPAFKIWELSHYDERGPAWYWNGFETGEHTGTHFDAPVHWVSGKDLPDNTVDRIPPKKFVGPACVIDISTEVAKNPNYLLTPERIAQWEKQHGLIPTGAWGSLTYGLVEANGPQGLHQPEGKRTPHARISQGKFCAPCRAAQCARRRRGNGRDRCRPSGHLRSTISQPLLDAWQRQVWLGQSVQP